MGTSGNATRIALKIWKDYLSSTDKGDLESGQSLVDRSLKRKVSYHINANRALVMSSLIL